MIGRGSPISSPETRSCSTILVRAFVTDRPASSPYAAPEVLEGADQTERSDLCSLGYVLVEMLSGVAPFAGSSNYADLLRSLGKARQANQLEERARKKRRSSSA